MLTYLLSEWDSSQALYQPQDNRRCSPSRAHFELHKGPYISKMDRLAIGAVSVHISNNKMILLLSKVNVPTYLPTYI